LGVILKSFVVLGRIAAAVAESVSVKMLDLVAMSVSPVWFLFNAGLMNL